MTHEQTPANTSEIKQAEILHDHDGLRFVRLSQEYTGPCGDADEMLATMTNEVVALTYVRLVAGKKVKKFLLTAEQMDTLTQAWLQFQAAQFAREEDRHRLETARAQQLAERARALGAELKETMTVEYHADRFSLVWPDDHRFRQSILECSYTDLDDIEEALNIAQDMTRQEESGRLR